MGDVVCQWPQFGLVQCAVRVRASGGEIPFTVLMDYCLRPNGIRDF